jgi:hypothetical protein
MFIILFKIEYLFEKNRFILVVNFLVVSFNNVKI